VKRSEPFDVSEVCLTSASREDQARGYLGRVKFVLNGRLRLDVALRRTLDGRHALSFPAKRDLAGRLRHVVQPLDHETRREIERQVFSALGLDPWIAR
jgi:DNA-binding cell septation regulator SpoVG